MNSTNYILLIMFVHSFIYTMEDKSAASLLDQSIRFAQMIISINTGLYRLAHPDPLDKAAPIDPSLAHYRITVKNDHFIKSGLCQQSRYTLSVENTQKSSLFLDNVLIGFDVSKSLEQKVTLEPEENVLNMLQAYIERDHRFFKLLKLNQYDHPLLKIAALITYHNYGIAQPNSIVKKINYYPFSRPMFDEHVYTHLYNILIKSDYSNEQLLLFLNKAKEEQKIISNQDIIHIIGRESILYDMQLSSKCFFFLIKEGDTIG